MKEKNLVYGCCVSKVKAQNVSYFSRLQSDEVFRFKINFHSYLTSLLLRNVSRMQCLGLTSTWRQDSTVSSCWIQIGQFKLQAHRSNAKKLENVNLRPRGPSPPKLLCGKFVSRPLVRSIRVLKHMWWPR